jgi:uncharacterized protein YceK
MTQQNPLRKCARSIVSIIFAFTVLVVLLLLNGCSSVTRYSSSSPGIYGHLIGAKYRSRARSVLTSNLWSPQMVWDDARKFDIPAGIDFTVVGVEVSDTPFVGITASPVIALRQPLKGYRSLFLSPHWAGKKDQNGVASLLYSLLDPRLAQPVP